MNGIKREKGITLIALIVTVLVLLIIATIGITTGTNTAESIEMKKFQDELQLIQARVDVVYSELKSGVKTVNDLGGELYVDRKDIIDRTLNEVTNEEGTASDFRYYTNQALEKYLGIENVTQSVLINWNTREVISVEGIKIGGIRYYTYGGTYKTDYLYQEVEYIESTGTQYIDTRYNANYTTSVIYDFEYLSGDTNKYIPILGQRVAIGSNMFGFWVYETNNSMAINYGTYDSSSISSTNCEGRHIYRNADNKFYLDDVLVKETAEMTFQSSASLSIFGLNIGTETETRGLCGRVYSLEIYNNNILVRDFMPCYRKIDGVIGLYDKVNGIFYKNAGTGEFIKGPDVEDKDITVTATNETSGDIKKVTVNVVYTENNVPVSDFTLKYRLQGETTWKIADYNYFETATEGIYEIEVSGNGINTKVETVGEYSLANFQQVEYIESTGTQYIDTGYIPSIKTSVKCKLNYADQTAFGSEGEISNDTLAVAGASGIEWVRFLKPTGDSLNSELTSNSIYELEINPTQAIYKSLDGTTKTISYSYSGTSTGYSLYLFARNLKGTVQENSYSTRKMYYFKIYDNDTLVRDFIPCYRKSDGVVGMYDVINNKFYTNAGTGEFTKGEDI